MKRTGLKGLRALAALALLIALAAAPVSVVAAEPNDDAACVGQFSRFYAQGGGGTHRSAVARDFAHNARPAGANVYSFVAQGSGSLEACAAQF
jgi:hypothetical protein